MTFSKEEMVADLHKIFEKASQRPSTIEGYASTVDLMEVSGHCRKTILKMLKEADKEGRLLVKQVHKPNVARRSTKRPVYKVLDESNNKSKKRPKASEA